MNRELIADALGELPERHIAAALEPPARGRRRYMRMAAALIAALLALTLGGTVVASAITGENMLSLLGSLWERRTGEPMSEAQTEIVEQMTQELGLSQTVDGVTVTVSSARVSGCDVWLLLRVEGPDFNERRKYSFDDYYVEVAEGFSSFTLGWYGVDESGAGVFVAEYTSEHSAASQAAEDELNVELSLGSLRELRQGQSAVEREGRIAAEGPWEFSFTLSAGEDLPSISIPELSYEPEDGTALKLLDVELSASGLGFRYYDPEHRYGFDAQVCAVLDGGARVLMDKSAGTSMRGGYWKFTGRWECPIDPAEVEYLLFGGEKIELP